MLATSNEVLDLTVGGGFYTVTGMKVQLHLLFEVGDCWRLQIVGGEGNTVVSTSARQTLKRILPPFTF